MSHRLCSCEAAKVVFVCAASLRITFSSTSSCAAHPGSQVSWNSHKMKSTRVCRDYWKKVPNQRVQNKYRTFENQTSPQNMAPSSLDLLQMNRDRGMTDTSNRLIMKLTCFLLYCAGKNMMGQILQGFCFTPKTLSCQGLDRKQGKLNLIFLSLQLTEHTNIITLIAIRNAIICYAYGITLLKITFLLTVQDCV